VNIARKKISSVMSRTVCRAGVDDSASYVLALLQKRAVSSVLVIEDEMILGIITERDIVRALHRGRDLQELGCVDLMQSPVITVTGNTNCIDAYHLMASRGIRHIGVTDGQGHVIGIASEGDVMRNFGVEYYMHFKTVGTVMYTDFCKLPATAMVAEALVQMIDTHQSCVVAVDAEGRPAGLLTERDVVRLCQANARPEALPVAEAMNSPVITVGPRKRLHTAVKAMEEKHIRRLVVVDDNGVACGVLTHHEIARGLEGDYAEFLKEIVAMQASHLQEVAQAGNDRLLLDNILRSVTGTAVLASDLEYRISYATPSVSQVLGLSTAEIGGTDLRHTLRRVGWHSVDASLHEESVAQGVRNYIVPTSAGRIEFQVSVLVDAHHNAQGYLVMAQSA
jgi:CBS domain-containing protein